MATKKAAQRRITRGIQRDVKRFVEIVGTDGARVAFDRIDEGRDAKAVMRELRPFIERHFIARRQRERGEV